MDSNPTPIIDITHLALSSPGMFLNGDAHRLAVYHGDVVAVLTDSPADGRHLLRVMATLAQPERGEYRFNGKIMDLKDYRQCLEVKRQIGYVAPDAALLSNQTLRENLLLSRFYAENDLSIALDNTLDSLCEGAGLSRMLDRRPSVLSDGELLKAIAVREMGKAPAVMLIDRPENFMEISENDNIFNHLRNMIGSGTAVVFVSHHSEMIGLANRQLTVAGGEIRTASV
ncbi:ATP-binding cassette domain-containing protein [Desulfosarcina sp.]|uniref:ATP-binding cassette domain-containing protein n=1 Tax=Desulfosarcina sp. TaxID=2027861 RepID=UPI0035657871